MAHYYLMLFYSLVIGVSSYSNNLYYIVNRSSIEIGSHCGVSNVKESLGLSSKPRTTESGLNVQETSYQTIGTADYYEEEPDPLLAFQYARKQVLRPDDPADYPTADYDYGLKKLKVQHNYEDNISKEDRLAHYPNGKVSRAELFNNRSAVHLPSHEMIHVDHSFLRITNDLMQTAVNAFAIFLDGSLVDVMRLPRAYVLRSARTISMMNIDKEKLVATWDIIKGKLRTDQVPHRMLEMYRPLFKNLNGREIARLNMSDERILNFIGTHPELNRHQVGVIASKYIRMNKDWMEARYLNQMNNLLCGVPISYMRLVAVSTYLQLSNQVFYHIKACDPIQKRFYLTMMTKTQTLGKSYSWSARDVSRLGLLLSEVDGADLAAVKPEAMSGLTAKVVLEIPPQTLMHITEMQLRYIAHKPLNILSKKLKKYREEIHDANEAIYMELSSLLKYFITCFVITNVLGMIKI